MEELAGPVAAPPALTKGERTRERILAAAEDVFAKEGFERTTLREVASLAGIQQPGLYKYFKNKNELYNAVLERMLHPLIEMLKDQRDAADVNRRMNALRVADLLIRSPNIAPLLMRAFLSTNAVERGMALDWMELVMEGRTRPRVGEGARDIDDALRDVALFNVCLGYFWTAPMIERLTGVSIRDESSIEAQKDLLRSLAAGLG
jgi:AcrR family transcriptional regulator